MAGQWGLIPWFAKTAKLQYSTNNARSEELAAKAAFKQPWARGQRCIIPARSFDEPCWETGKNVWWRFRGPTVSLGAWLDYGAPGRTNSPAKFTRATPMLTVNADHHPLMQRMHKPDPHLPTDQQDKRSVVPLAPQVWDAWLAGTTEEAISLFLVPDATCFDPEFSNNESVRIGGNFSRRLRSGMANFEAHIAAAEKRHSRRTADGGRRSKKHSPKLGPSTPKNYLPLL